MQSETPAISLLNALCGSAVFSSILALSVRALTVSTQREVLAFVLCASWVIAFTCLCFTVIMLSIAAFGGGMPGTKTLCLRDIGSHWHALKDNPGLTLTLFIFSFPQAVFSFFTLLRD